MGRGEHRANSHQQDFLLICGMRRGEASVAPDRSNSHQQDFLLVNQQCLLSYSMTNIEFHVILEVEENKSEIYYLVKNNVQAVG